MDARLKQARGRSGNRAGRAGGGRSPSVGIGFRVGSELVAGVAVGSLVGWGLDRAFGTAPWIFVVGFVFGAAAGLLNVTRAASRIADETNRREPPASEDERA